MFGKRGPLCPSPWGSRYRLSPGEQNVLSLSRCSCEVQVCWRANRVHPQPPVPLDPLSSASSTADCRQQRGLAKISRTELCRRPQGPSAEMLFSSLGTKHQLRCLSPAADICMLSFFSLSRALRSRTFFILHLKKQRLCAEPEFPAPGPPLLCGLRFSPRAGGGKLSFVLSFQLWSCCLLGGWNPLPT